MGSGEHQGRSGRVVWFETTYSAEVGEYGSGDASRGRAESSERRCQADYAAGGAAPTPSAQ